MTAFSLDKTAAKRSAGDVQGFARASRHRSWAKTEASPKKALRSPLRSATQATDSTLKGCREKKRAAAKAPAANDSSETAQNRLNILRARSDTSAAFAAWRSRLVR
jgi:hypothetical protein